MSASVNSQASNRNARSVPAGYKQTEIGEIPEDWEVKFFADLFDFSGGFSASRDQLAEVGYCYLHYGDIHGSTKTYIDTCGDYQDIPKLDIPLNKISPKSILADGDVVFVDASEDDEGISRHVCVVNKDDVPFISGLHTIVAKGKTDELAHTFRRFCFQSAIIHEQFRYYAVGTKVTGINKSNIPKLFLAVPPLPEQRAIATALSDVDALLDGLDRLITKKRDLKQAAMQGLLSPPAKTVMDNGELKMENEGSSNNSQFSTLNSPLNIRLPGFEGEWEVKRLGDIADIRSGGTPSTTKAEFWDGGVPWCTPTDITALRGNKYLSETERTITEAGLRASSAEVIPSNSIIMTSRATIGECAINTVPMTTNQGFKNLIPSEAEPEFLYYLMTTQKEQLIQLCGGSTFLEISKKQLQRFEVASPVETEEQTAIATVLSDMDDEIAVLEQRRNKTKDIKQAMMQELLTGKIRLVN